MSYETEQIAAALKASRENKGLSQRALSEKSGILQAQISKIENGSVDLRLSSLVALARGLDLEVTLVPRKALPAVQSVVRSNEPAPGGKGSIPAFKALQNLQRTIASIQDAAHASTELAQLQRQVRELQNFRLAAPQLETLKEAQRAVQAFREQTKGLEALRGALSQVRKMRNALAHASVGLSSIELVRPVYSLEEEEGGDA